jgi:hypothetical protein
MARIWAKDVFNREFRVSLPLLECRVFRIGEASPRKLLIWRCRRVIASVCFIAPLTLVA